MKPQIINFLWAGDKLSFLEVAVLKSHVAVGHQCKLWTYANTPMLQLLRQDFPKISFGCFDHALRTSSSPK